MVTDGGGQVRGYIHSHSMETQSGEFDRALHEG